MKRRNEWRLNLLIISVGAIAIVLPLSVYLLFNKIIFGSLLGGYFSLVSDNGGYVAQDVLDRAYSHLVDSGTYYAEPHADWLSNLPVLLFGICFIPVILITGSTFMRTCAAVAIVQIALVYSYADAVPTGQFRFLNIHYMKWMYPVLAAFPLYIFREQFRNDRHWKPIDLLPFALGASIFLTVISIRPSYQVDVPSETSVIDPTTLRIDFARDIEVDFIDIAGLHLPVDRINQLDQSLVIMDNYGERTLRPRSEVRVTPRSDGLRILLTDKTRLRSARVTLAGFGDLTKTSEIQALAGLVTLRVAWPWSPQTQPPTWPIIENKTYYTNATGIGTALLETGWSEPEKWGTWMRGPVASLQFLMPDALASGGHLTIDAQGFVADSKAPLKVDVLVNDQSAAILEFRDSTPKTVDIPLARSGELSNRHVRVEFRALSTLSPASIGMNNDTRELSLGLISVEVRK